MVLAGVKAYHDKKIKDYAEAKNTQVVISIKKILSINQFLDSVHTFICLVARPNRWKIYDCRRMHDYKIKVPSPQSSPSDRIA